MKSKIISQTIRITKSWETWAYLFILLVLTIYFNSSLASPFWVLLITISLIVFSKILSLPNEENFFHSAYIFLRRLFLLVVILSIATCANNTRDKKINIAQYNLENGIKLKFIIFARYIGSIPGSYIFEPQLLINKERSKRQIDEVKTNLPYIKIFNLPEKFSVKYDNYGKTKKFLKYRNKRNIHENDFYSRSRLGEWDIYIDNNIFTENEFKSIESCIRNNRTFINNYLLSEDLKKKITKTIKPKRVDIQKLKMAQVQITSTNFFSYINSDVEIYGKKDEKFKLVIYKHGAVCLGISNENIYENFGKNSTFRKIGQISTDGRYIKLFVPQNSMEIWGTESPNIELIKDFISKYKDKQDKTLIDYFQVYQQPKT